MRHCEYAKPNGTFCGSPALRGRDYCHWHLTCVARRLRAEKQEATQDRTPLELPPLEDANSIQLAIMTVMDAILHDRVGPRKGNQLLYALQLASNNLKQGVCFQPGKQAADTDRNSEDVTLCSSYDSLEADYDIAEHAGQLQAAEPNARFGGETKDQSQQQEPLTVLQQYRKDHPSQGEDYHPTATEMHQWRDEKEQAEQRKLEWRTRIDDLAKGIGFKDAREMKKLVDDGCRLAGLEYETEGWKPAPRQLVLFPRKPPEGVQQQWHEQRHANCTAEIDQAIADQAARKKIS